ncbi:hypothetical protein E1B28_012511 [Marasmius oreades]|uniref:Heterokaryon incompatibility domain-containing protein n=1 Tax=Marasmius oreades TaxID=181124 RepID=A0A9P7RT01_9AGAR|nr:uncharacterized protein E1B28_012511 [Marasmius oreades]KAG7088528.1 hypothetical protein E1B28_012511 [Marasmius oreades]
MTLNINQGGSVILSAIAGQKTGLQSQSEPVSAIQHRAEEVELTTNKPLTPSDLPRPPLARAVYRHIFRPCPWLGVKHDGYPMLSLRDYQNARKADSHGTPNPEEYVALFQAQLTFGLLEAVMEIKLSESMMVVDRGGGTVLIDEHLPDLLADWRSRIKKLGRGEECRKWAERVEEALQVARRFLHMEITFPRNSPFRVANTSWELHCAILITCAAIGEALTSSRRIFPPEYISQGISWTFISMMADLHARDMLKNGWCPFTVSIIVESGICGLGYASTRHPPVRDGSHANCSKDACILNNIDTSTYRNKHVSPCGECSYIKPSLDSVLAYLCAGEIPVVEYNSAARRLSVFPASSVPYVAISHVWVDGFGSTTEVGLPLCQIELLHSKVEEMGVGGGFWMDSLCVPAEQELRRQAIRLMAKTYREARATLVFDSGIRCCSAAAPLEEKLLSVLSCGWMQRLWTLQEALLARRLTFAFADCLEDIDKLLPVGEDQLLDSLVTGLSGEIFRMVKHQRSLVNSASFGIGDLARSLQWRSTSKSGDETLAIAGLANVDAKELVKLPSHERMRIFLLRVQELPSNIIFMSVPKLDEPGFRWAPRTLMQRGGSPMAVSHAYEAICTPTGLLAEYAAVYFQRTEVRRDTQWFLSNITKKRFYRATVVAADDSAETYSCNTLLMMKLPGPADLVICAAVLVTEIDTEEQGDRMVCQYKQRILLAEIPEFKLQQENQKKFIEARSGRMLTRVT